MRRNLQSLSGADKLSEVDVSKYAELKAEAEGLGDWFAKSSTQASSNYGIDRDGRVGMYVEEKNRSWCSSSNANDQRAITIECASDTTEPYAFRDVVYQRLIELCIDICRRNGKNKLIWFGDKDKTLNYSSWCVYHCGSESRTGLFSRMGQAEERWRLDKP